MEVLLMGLLYGLGSGLHCAAMCSPVYLVLLGNDEKDPLKIFYYYVGKLTGYFLIYGVFYALFRMFSFFIPFEYLKIFSLFLGLMLVVLFLWKGLSNAMIAFLPVSAWMNRILRINLSPVFRRYLLSLFSGMIPCHLSYSLLFLASVALKPSEAMVFIVAFHSVSLLWVVLPNELLKKIPIRNIKTKKIIYKSILVLSILLIVWRSFQFVDFSPFQQSGSGHSLMFCKKNP